ncbi:disks large homolog 1-like [Columba livia]|uniref:Disks large homolog 1-like n=1 Tax=Columba livia TaxID=8932 RepID=A0A2I0M4R3_COLLI|nr:disks large homolog 1-like [Columba livia]
MTCYSCVIPADTERAVEILTRYQSTLQSPEEQELKASIGKVSHIFQSELFQALLDIHEFYDFTLRSAPLQPPSRDARGDTARQQHGASKPSSTVIPREPQNLPEDPSQSAEQRLLAGAGDSTPGTPPRLVRVTARRTEAPASVCSLVLGSRSTLLQDFMWRKEKTTRAEMPATPDKT